jgi:hypothetical protein
VRYSVRAWGSEDEVGGNGRELAAAREAPRGVVRAIVRSLIERINKRKKGGKEKRK